MTDQNRKWYPVGKIVQVSKDDNKKKTFALRINDFVDLNHLMSLLNMQVTGTNGKEYPNSLMISTPHQRSDESQEEFEKRTSWFVMEAFIRNPNAEGGTEPQF